jgi:hypothetical protein
MNATPLTAAELNAIDFKKIKTIDLSKLVSSVDLRPVVESLGLSIRNQNNRPTCSVFASTFLIEYMTARERGLTGLDFSEEYLNTATNRVSGDAYDGDFFDNIGIGYHALGIVDEEWLRYRDVFDPALSLDDALMNMGKAASFFNSDFMYADSPHSSISGFNAIQVAAILKQLNKSIPVAVGVQGGEISTVQVDGHNAWNEIQGDEEWAHCVDLVGYKSGPLLDGKGYFIFRNSGGPLWGDDGYGYMTFNYVEHYANDAVIYGRSPHFLPPMHSIPKPLKRIKMPVPPPAVMHKLGKLINPKSRIQQD